MTKKRLGLLGVGQQKTYFNELFSLWILSSDADGQRVATYTDVLDCKGSPLHQTDKEENAIIFS